MAKSRKEENSAQKGSPSKLSEPGSDSKATDISLSATNEQQVTELQQSAGAGADAGASEIPAAAMSKSGSSSSNPAVVLPCTSVNPPTGAFATSTRQSSLRGKSIQKFFASLPEHDTPKRRTKAEPEPRKVTLDPNGSGYDLDFPELPCQTPVNESSTSTPTPTVARPCDPPTAETDRDAAVLAWVNSIPDPDRRTAGASRNRRGSAAGASRNRSGSDADNWRN